MVDGLVSLRCRFRTARNRVGDTDRGLHWSTQIPPQANPNRAAPVEIVGSGNWGVRANPCLTLVTHANGMPSSNEHPRTIGQYDHAIGPAV